MNYMVDSGATDPVIPIDEVPEVPVEESAASKEGVHYRVANNEEIPNLGEQHLIAHTWNGEEWGRSKVVTTQVADVSQPIIAVDTMIGNDHTVAFDSGGTLAYDKLTGEYTPFRRDNGTFHMPMWVNVAAEAPKSEAGFTRPGR